MKAQASEHRVSSSPWPFGSLDSCLLVLLLGVFLLSYRSAITSLMERWDTDPNYGHGYLVPFVSLYLFRRSISGERFATLVGSSFSRGALLTGFLLVFVGIMVRFATVVVDSIVADSFSMLVVIAGLVLMIGGWRIWSRSWASIAFLCFMVPWPAAVHSRVALPLQLLVSGWASANLQIFGIPVLRDGNLIHLPRETMHVAEACSGLRQLTAFLAVCACAALLADRPRWYRWFVFASAIPIAVVINVLRVTATGLMLQFGLGEWTEGALHTFEGMLMVGLGLAVLVLEMNVLDWLLEDGPAESRKPALAGG